MNKIVFSRWEPIYFAELEFYLDNSDKIILKYKQTKNLPQTIESVEGNRYSLITNDGKIIGFNRI